MTLKLECICRWCDGKGLRQLGGTYAKTWMLLCKGPATGAALARVAKCKATAMNNRLRVLEDYGFATSKVDGRRRIYTAVT